MKKLLLAGAMIAVLMPSCKKSSITNHGDGEGSIILGIETNTNVEFKTRAHDSSYDYLIALEGPETKSFELEETTVNVKSGDYKITATTPVSYTMPAFATPVYQGSTNVTVVSGESAAAQMTLTQINTGVKFVFDESIRKFYDNLTVKIEDNANAAATLSYTYADETAAKIAYFEPGTLKFSLTDNGSPIKLGGADYATRDVAKRQVWTITLTTSEVKPGNVDFEINVDDTTDDKTDDWGVGTVEGEGTFSAPYSVSGAINSMPVEGKWIEGYIVGEATVTTRSSNALYFGPSPEASPSECIVMEVVSAPELAQFGAAEYEGKKLKFKADVTKNSVDFTTDAKAVMLKVTDYDSDTRETGLDGTKAITLSGKTLKEIAAAQRPIFRMGACVNGGYFMKGDSEYKEDCQNLVKRDFNSISFEYEMKLTELVKLYAETEKNQYYWGETRMNDMIKFAKDNGIDVHGHTLVWYKDFPDEWEAKSDEEVKVLLEEFIDKTIRKYDYVRSWDVVNEAFNNADGSYRVHDAASSGKDYKNLWYRVWGKDYIKEVFKIARRVANEVNPEIKLFYNDYGTETYSNKRDAITREINAINAEYAAENGGAKLIDGIGLQMHLIAGQNKNSLKAAIQAALDTDLLIHISELSVSLAKEEADVPATVSQELLDKQTQTFNDIIDLSMTMIPKEKLWGITTWGVSDHTSIYKKRQGLLFDKEFKAKRPYFDIIAAFAN